MRKTAAAIPTAISFHGSNETSVTGEKAIDALKHDKDSDTIVNWKLFLGLTPRQLMAERSERPMLDRILQHRDLKDIATEYFSRTLPKFEQEFGVEVAPQYLVGIPSSSDTGSVAARDRYRNVIKTAFKQLKYPEPRFFAEPLAIFQHVSQTHSFGDTDRSLNVLVLDIGGGTSNACVIRTSAKGRLRRGGENHMPFGVKTNDVGGSKLDMLIIERAVKTVRPFGGMELARYTAKLAKEKISRQLNALSRWEECPENDSITQTISVEAMGDWELSANDLIKTFEHKFWPHIDSLLGECIDSAKKAARFDQFRIDRVVFAGGTCQARIFERLVRRSFSEKLEDNVEFITLDNYQQAVANGLAIEASIHSRHHKLKPIRIAPLIQQNLMLSVGHSQELYKPVDLRQLTPDLGEKTTDGVLIVAPMVYGELVERKLSWSFRLKKTSSKTIYISLFSKQPNDELNDLFEHQYMEPITLSKENRKQGVAYFKLHISPLPEGYADVSLVVFPKGGKGKATTYKVNSLYIHEFDNIDSDVFCGLDFGTDSTACTFMGAETVAPALPDKYEYSRGLGARAEELELSFMTMPGGKNEILEALDRYSDEQRADYVYHSNRIEGVSLNRGETQGILEAHPDSLQWQKENFNQHLSETVNYVEDDGTVKEVRRAIKDKGAAVNLGDAYNFVRTCSADPERSEFTSSWLKELHSLVMRGDDKAEPGTFRRTSVEISSTTFVPPEPVHVDALIEKFCDEVNSSLFLGKPAICQASIAHAVFVSIHPFQDGNGRVARLIANLFLWRKGFPGIKLPYENRDRYYDALEECNSTEPSVRGELDDLVSLFCDLLESSVSNILSLVRNCAPSEFEDEVTIDSGEARGNRLSLLIEKLGSGKHSVNLQDQYERWYKFHSSVVAQFHQDSSMISEALLNYFGGGLHVKEFPVIDFDTYRKFKKGEVPPVSWLLKADLKLARRHEEIVLFFAPQSDDILKLRSDFANAVSLYIAKYDSAKGKHIRSSDEGWCNLLEISHNGVVGALLSSEGRDQSPRLVLESEQEFKEWPTIIFEDLINEEYRRQEGA